MPSEANFWIPVYYEKVDIPSLSKEIDEILPKIREQDKFIKPDHWDKDHNISTNIDDRTDTIKDFNMVKLGDLISQHINKYIKDVELQGDNNIFRGDSWVNINNKGDSQEWHIYNKDISQ